MPNPAVRGVYRKGKVTLLEPAPTSDERAVLVVFLDDEQAEEAWRIRVRRSFLKGYAPRDKAYDAL